MLCFGCELPLLRQLDVRLGHRQGKLNVLYKKNGPNKTLKKFAGQPRGIPTQQPQPFVAVGSDVRLHPQLFKSPVSFSKNLTKFTLSLQLEIYQKSVQTESYPVIS